MYKLALIPVLGVIAVSCGQDADLPPPTSSAEVLEITEVVEPVIAQTDITSGTPADVASTVPLFTGVDPAAVYRDTTRPDNFFYTTDAHFGEVDAFFATALPDATRASHSATASSYELMTGGGLRTTVFISTEKPTIYPAEYTTGATFVTVLYNQKPLPTADDVLGL